MFPKETTADYFFVCTIILLVGLGVFQAMQMIVWFFSRLHWGS